MVRNLVIAGLVLAALTGTTTSSQAVVLSAESARSDELGLAAPARYEDPGFTYGYNSYQGYQPYYYGYPSYYRHARPQYRYYRQYPAYGDYYYRPHRPHRFWWRW